MGTTMQDDRASIQKNDEDIVPSHIRQRLEYLGDLWQRSHEPSATTLRRIAEFVVSLPEPYRVMGLKAIAEHFVNNISLHFLDIMATFQQKAEYEGLDAEEREETFRDILPELFPTMMGLSKCVSVQSIDDLLTLSNITLGLYRHSQLASAEGAQRWMYKLPAQYCNQLAREHLAVSMQTQLTVTLSSTTTQTTGFIAWDSSITTNKTQSPQVM